MNRWYFPSWNGDFRLLSDERGTVLEIVDLTPAELPGLTAFLKVAKKKKWTKQKGIYRSKTEEKTNRSDVELEVDLSTAGIELLKHLRPADRTITAVSSTGGQLTVHDASALTPEVMPKDAEKAVSLARPTPSCPQCVDGPSRASEVLDAFLSPEERDLWQRERCLIVTGGMSGHRYCVAHRHSEKARRIGRMCFDLDDRGVMHFHANDVPPEEEVLAAKLILEHREPWLRNEATCLYFENSGREIDRFTDVFKNPFGDLNDGAADRRIAMIVGTILR